MKPSEQIHEFKYLQRAMEIAVQFMKKKLQLENQSE